MEEEKEIQLSEEVKKKIDEILSPITSVEKKEKASQMAYELYAVIDTSNQELVRKNAELAKRKVELARRKAEVEYQLRNPLKDKLFTLYEYEKFLLDLLKDYKEEIKFAVSLQTELRKEQANFFSSTLKEVCDSLKDEQISKECAKKWIEDLVASYTSSLKLSYQLADENIITSIGNIKEEINNTINKINE